MAFSEDLQVVYAKWLQKVRPKNVKTYEFSFKVHPNTVHGEHRVQVPSQLLTEVDAGRLCCREIKASPFSIFIQRVDRALRFTLNHCRCLESGRSSTYKNFPTDRRFYPLNDPFDKYSKTRTPCGIAFSSSCEPTLTVRSSVSYKAGEIGGSNPLRSDAILFSRCSFVCVYGSLLLSNRSLTTVIHNGTNVLDERPLVQGI